MKTILQMIEKMEQTEKRADRNQILLKEYNVNQKLRMMMDMIYGENLELYVKKLPDFEPDPDTPNGLHYSNLERNMTTLSRILYDPNFGKNRERALVRILENVAPQEVDVIKAMIQNKWRWCTMKFYADNLVENG